MAAQTKLRAAVLRAEDARREKPILAMVFSDRRTRQFFKDRAGGVSKDLLDVVADDVHAGWKGEHLSRKICRFFIAHNSIRVTVRH